MIIALTLPKMVAYINAGRGREDRVEGGVTANLKVFFQSLFEWVRDLVELVELSDALHGRVVARRAAVETLDDGAHVSENTGVHERCMRVPSSGVRREKEREQDLRLVCDR